MVMMDDKLLKRLDELNDINSQMMGMASLLEILDEHFERANKEEICEGILVMQGWLKNLQAELIHTMDALDRYILEK